MSPVILVAIIFQLIAIRVGEVGRRLAAAAVDFNAVCFERFLRVLESGGTINLRHTIFKFRSLLTAILHDRVSNLYIP